VQITARDYDFSPDVIKVQRGTTLRVRFVNKGSHPHSLVFDFPSLDRTMRTLRPGESATINFRVPNQRGTYTFFCPIGDHAERGMRGELIVR
jgi:plastocyanin